MNLSKEIQRELVSIKKHVIENFKQDDWEDLSRILGCYDIVKSHERLLRSLYFDDDDYPSCAMFVLTKFVETDKENLNEIKKYLESKYGITGLFGGISTQSGELPKKEIKFSPQVFTIPDKQQVENLVAVMFPFINKSTFQTIQSVCHKLELDCKKADDIWENSTFIQDIFNLIFTCKVVIADFTGRNPNVFYEVGIAHTLGKIVIPITQNIDDVPSDLRHHRVLKYLANEQGLEQLAKELEQKLSSIFSKKQNKFDSH